jgi:putative transposase
MSIEDGVSEEMIYHAYCRGNNKMKIFHVGYDYAKYKRNIIKYKEKYRFKLYAYSLMPNHLHLLLELQSPGDITKVMKSLNLSYSAWHNRRYGCVGHVWQGRYKHRSIENDNDFLFCMAYIEMNPVKAGLTDVAEDYKWSSCYERFKKTKDRIIDFHPIYLDLSPNEQERRRVYYEIMHRNAP